MNSYLVAMLAKRSILKLMLFVCVYCSSNTERVDVFSCRYFAQRMNRPALSTVPIPPFLRSIRGGRVIYGTLPAKADPELRTLNLQVLPDHALDIVSECQYIINDLKTSC